MKKIFHVETVELKKTEQLWKQAQALGFPMKASVVRRRFRCGKPGCPCAKGKRHQDMIVTRNMGGKTQTIRIRSGREASALEWVENWRKLKSILAKLTAIELRILRLPRAANQPRAQKDGSEKAGGI
jgi:hypothetical protein